MGQEICWVKEGSQQETTLETFADTPSEPGTDRQAATSSVG